MEITKPFHEHNILHYFASTLVQYAVVLSYFMEQSSSWEANRF
jgi:hypothetical protein